MNEYSDSFEFLQAYSPEFMERQALSRISNAIVECRWKVSGVTAEWREITGGYAGPWFSVSALKPRKPWINQPDCLHCHLEYQPPDTDTLAMNAWTEGEPALYCNRTDETGRLFCAACHSSAHAVHPAVNPYGSHLDALQPLQYQLNRLPLGSNRNCALCHTVEMEDEMHHNNSLRDFRNE